MNRADPIDLVRRRLDEDPGDEAPALAELAREAGLSPSQLSRGFKQRTGLSPRDYAAARRRERLKRALRAEPDVSAAIYAAGYGSPSRVYERSDELIGMTPARYARGAEGIAIRYTTVELPIGNVLVAATERGLCAVTLGDDAAALEAALAAEFPRAQRERVDEGANDWLAAAIERIAATLGLCRARETELPFDVTATAFQWAVWRELMRIPAGETRSYREIAQAVGRPSAVRAVARACASNRIAVMVPCHRVIREDGTLGGYRWGLPRKRELLARERAAVAPAGLAEAALSPQAAGA